MVFETEKSNKELHRVNRLDTQGQQYFFEPKTNNVQKCFYK